MEQSEQTTDSLYDFIYIDDHKSKILLAQLEVNGILTQIKNRIQEEDSSSSELGVDKLFVLKKNGNTTESESIEHSFDTSLSVHLNLLHKLSEQKRIKKEISTSVIGDIVVFTGEVNILDISTLQKLATSIHLFDESKKDKKQKQVTEIIKVLPSQIQFTFKDKNGYRAWMTLSDKNMLISSSDLMLKYGNSFDGEWTVLGILDSIPNTGNIVQADDREAGKRLSQIAEQFKKMMGKSPTHFGITPLMIFRKINK